MSPKSQDDKNFLNMAGEFLVAAELNRRGILCAVTYGTAKSADVWAFDKSGNRAVRIEVKTTGPGSRRWVVGEKPLRQEASPDVLWVLVALPEPHSHAMLADDESRGRHCPRFYVLTSGEMREILDARHRAYCERYRRAHGKDFTARGVPNMGLVQVQDCENRWDKIKDRVQSSVSA